MDEKVTVYGIWIKRPTIKGKLLDRFLASLGLERLHYPNCRYYFCVLGRQPLTHRMANSALCQLEVTTLEGMADAPGMRFLEGHRGFLLYRDERRKAMETDSVVVIYKGYEIDIYTSLQRAHQAIDAILGGRHSYSRRVQQIDEQSRPEE